MLMPARHGGRPDLESDALRVSGAVDQGHYSAWRQTKKDPGAGARQGFGVCRRSHQLDAVPGSGASDRCVPAENRSAGAFTGCSPRCSWHSAIGVPVAGGGAQPPRGVFEMQAEGLSPGVGDGLYSRRWLPGFILHRIAHDSNGGDAVYCAFRSVWPPALGAALTQSGAVRACAFLRRLGLGLALPYVLLSFAPSGCAACCRSRVRG